MDTPIVTPDDGPRPTGGDAESPLDESVLAETADVGTDEIPVYTFSSFDELKAAVEADPPTHDAHGLYNYVQARLQRPGNFVVRTDEELNEIWQAMHSAPGDFVTAPAKEEFDRKIAFARAQHTWLKDALVKLEERAFGPIRREPAKPIPQLSGADHAAIRHEAFQDFEALWHDRVGGDLTQDLRFMIGIAMGQIVGKYSVHPRALADYLREALRAMEPDKFDAP